MKQSPADQSERPAPGATPTQYLPSVPFGERLTIERFVLGNGLRVFVLSDHSAPVVSFQTWIPVGSSHETAGKTGQAHLLEHLMFGATRETPKGEFDRLLEAAGAETNAATWVDWTAYYENVPASELELVIRLEADRMRNLVLEDPEVISEKDVVLSERRDRVEDDVEGKASELLYALAFGEDHPYGWPTIGWQRDIEGFTTQDCLAFYRDHYAPDSALVVMVGDVDKAEAERLLTLYYSEIPPSGRRAFSDAAPRPQKEERRVEVELPTETAKLNVGWHAPAYPHRDHAVLNVLLQILASGRSSWLYRDMVRERELATEVRASMAPFRHASLLDVWISVREGKTRQECLEALDSHIARLLADGVTEDELSKARNRLELGFLGALETSSGKADQIGFCAVVADDAAHTFTRLEEYRSVTREDVSRVAAQVFDKSRRTIVSVTPSPRGEGEDEDGDEDDSESDEDAP